MTAQIIYEDTRQQVHNGDKHQLKHEFWGRCGVPIVRKKLDVGDYSTDGSDTVIDTKRSVQEVSQNINGRNHERFKRECIRARDAGKKLVILVENDEGVRNLQDLAAWLNTHCRYCSYRTHRKCDPNNPAGKCPRHNKRKPIQGERLARAMRTMSERYGVQFMFCPPEQAGRIICDLLGIDLTA